MHEGWDRFIYRFFRLTTNMSEVPITFSRATREETNSLPDSWSHTVHILIYAKTDDAILFGDKLPAEHTILVRINSIQFFILPFEKLLNNAAEVWRCN